MQLAAAFLFASLLAKVRSIFASLLAKVRILAANFIHRTWAYPSQQAGWEQKRQQAARTQASFRMPVMRNSRQHRGGWCESRVGAAMMLYLCHYSGSQNRGTPFDCTVPANREAAGKVAHPLRLNAAGAVRGPPLRSLFPAYCLLPTAYCSSESHPNRLHLKRLHGNGDRRSLDGKRGGGHELVPFQHVGFARGAWCARKVENGG